MKLLHDRSEIVAKSPDSDVQTMGPCVISSPPNLVFAHLSVNTVVSEYQVSRMQFVFSLEGGRGNCFNRLVLREQIHLGVSPCFAIRPAFDTTLNCACCGEK